MSSCGCVSLNFCVVGGMLFVLCFLVCYPPPPGFCDWFSIINVVLNRPEQSVLFPLAYTYVLLQQGKHTCVGRMSKRLNVI